MVNDAICPGRDDAARRDEANELPVQREAVKALGQTTMNWPACWTVRLRVTPWSASIVGGTITVSDDSHSDLSDCTKSGTSLVMARRRIGSWAEGTPYLAEHHQTIDTAHRFPLSNMRNLYIVNVTF